MPLTAPILSKNGRHSTDRTDRLFYHLMEPEHYPINDRDAAHLEKLRLTFQIISEESQLKRAVEMLKAVLPEEYSEAHYYRLINDSQALFGGVIRRNKAFDRMIIRERLMALAERAKEAGEMDQERRCLEAVMKLEGLDQHLPEAFDYADLAIPAPLFTSDTSTMLAAVEDIPIVGDEEEE